MSDKQVSQETVAKALEALQDLAKGHSSRGTATTAVESMQQAGVGAGSSAGASQIHHTASNSDPGTWAGSGQRRSPENGASDAVDENGTDYRGGAEMVKSILSKLARGIPLNAREAQVYADFAKGSFGADEKEEKAEKAFPPPKGKDEDEDEDKEKEMGKSLAQHAEANEEVRKGFEMSSFLAGWADVQSQALSSTQDRILGEVSKGLDSLAGRQENFNGVLAKSLASLGEVLALQAQRIEQLESTPARGPKSVGVEPVAKSFQGGEPEGEKLNKSIILDVMSDMVVKGELSATEVVKFESTSMLTPELESRVRAHRSGR